MSRNAQLPSSKLGGCCSNTVSSGDQRGGGVTEASSLLGGSPRRPCGQKGSPYHTGQLHPVALVADLLQHINQVKTAEGYGFKQDKVPGPVQLGPLPRASLGSFLLHPSHQVVTEEIGDGGCKGSGALGTHWGTTVNTPAVIIIPSSGPGWMQ
ncbi:hypothetical protein R6Z07F_003388 [Ovis aries]